MKEVHYAKHIKTFYLSLIPEMGGDEFKDARPSYQNMENKLLNQFGDEACIIQRSTRQGNIIFRKTLSISDASQKKIVQQNRRMFS